MTLANIVARMERSEIRDSRDAGPGLRCAPSGLVWGCDCQGVIDQGMFFSWSVIVERDALVVALSFRWLTAAPGAAAVKAGRRPPPEAARSGLDGGEAGARLSDRNVSVRAVSGMTRHPGLGRDVVMRKTPHQLVSGRAW